MRALREGPHPLPQRVGCRGTTDTGNASVTRRDWPQMGSGGASADCPRSTNGCPDASCHRADLFRPENTVWLLTRRLRTLEYSPLSGAIGGDRLAVRRSCE